MGDMKLPALWKICMTMSQKRKRNTDDHPQPKKAAIKEKNETKIELHRKISFLKKYDYLKQNIEKSEFDNVAAQLYSDGYLELQEYEELVQGEIRFPLKVDQLLKKTLLGRDGMVPVFLERLRTSSDFMVHEIEHVPVSEEDEKGYRYSISGKRAEHNTKTSNQLRGFEQHISVSASDVDPWNDYLLKHFHFTIQDHNDVCNAQGREKASLLLKKMERCPSLNLRRLTAFRKEIDEATNNSLKSQIGERDEEMVQQLRASKSIERYSKEALGLLYKDVKFGSIVLIFKPLSAKTFEKLQQVLDSKEIKTFFKHIFGTEKMLALNNGKDMSFYMDAFVQGLHATRDEENPALSESLRILFRFQEVDGSKRTLSCALWDNFEVLADEIDSKVVSDLLVDARLIPAETFTNCREKPTRSSRVFTLFQAITDPKKGFEVILNHLKNKKMYYALKHLKNRFYSAEIKIPVVQKKSTWKWREPLQLGETEILSVQWLDIETEERTSIGRQFSWPQWLVLSGASKSSTGGWSGSRYSRSESRGSVQKLLESMEQEGEASSTSAKPRKYTSTPLRVLLIGKPGTGKSSVGNAILGRDDFKTGLRISSITSKCQRGYTKRHGIDFMVVDTPGLSDVNPYSNSKDFIRELARCFAMTAPGPHAIVYVTAVGRITMEDQAAIEYLRLWFGEDMFKHTVFLFTHTDVLECENLKIEEYLQDCLPLQMQKFLEKCNNRFVTFRKDKELSIEELLEMIIQMQKDNPSYCSNIPSGMKTNAMPPDVGTSELDFNPQYVDYVCPELIEEISLEMKKIDLKQKEETSQTDVERKLLKLFSGLSTLVQNMGKSEPCIII